VRKRLDSFAIGVGVGYVLGTRAGREQYDRIVTWWNRATGNPVAERLGKQGRGLIGQAAHWAEDRAQKVPVGRTILGVVRPEGDANGTVADVMTATVETIRPDQTLADAAGVMKAQDVGGVIVTDAAGQVRGIVTDRDVAVRGVADGKGPQARVEEVLSEEIVTVAPDNTVADAVRLMRQHAVRRLPVVVDGRPVGIVSLGDLAIERDPDSTLADISMAASNR
jgi:CBS domain-containing protein